MKAPASQVVIIVCSLLLVSCTKINLHGGKGGTAPAKTTTGGSILPGSQPAQQPAATDAPPPVDGDWEVDFEFKGTPAIGNVTFAQSGTVLTGQGQDQDGKQWQVDSGQVQGTKVSFGKVYAGSTNPPIKYEGDLKYLQSPEYTGWAMEGKYSVTGPDGTTIGGKWVANPTGPPPQDAAQAPPGDQQQQQPAGNPFFGGANGVAKSTAPDHIGDAQPTDISGHYDGSYNFNFKKVKSKMWIENDGSKITGRGYDVSEKAAHAKPAKGKDKPKEAPANENFTIARGYYKYPDVTIIRQYVKGKGASETRNVTFRAKLSSNGRDIVMKGETQFGGSWDAHRL